MRRIFCALLFSAALILGMRPGAHAQETPVPQTVGTSVSDQEVTILKGFFDKLNEAAQGDPDAKTGPTLGDIVTDVIKTVNADADAESSDEDDESDDEAKEDDDDSDDDREDDADNDSDDEDDDGKGKDKKKNKDKKSDKSKGRGDGLPPGLQKQLAKNGQLPPGLQRKLEESGALPPGLQASGLPDELEAELPELPEGQERVIVDNDILIVEEVTGAVLDAIPDIIPPDLVPILNQLPTILQDQQ